MQPWEKEKTVNRKGKKKKKRSLKQKLGLAVEGLSLSLVCCSVIYSTLLYECAKQYMIKTGRYHQK